MKGGINKKPNMIDLPLYPSLYSTHSNSIKPSYEDREQLLLEFTTQEEESILSKCMAIDEIDNSFKSIYFNTELSTFIYYSVSKGGYVISYRVRKLDLKFDDFFYGNLEYKKHVEETTGVKISLGYKNKVVSGLSIAEGTIFQIEHKTESLDEVRDSINSYYVLRSIDYYVEKNILPLLYSSYAQELENSSSRISKIKAEIKSEWLKRKTEENNEYFNKK